MREDCRVVVQRARGFCARERRSDAVTVGANERESDRRTYMVAGSAKLSGYATALAVFMMFGASLLPSIRGCASLSFSSRCLFLAILLACFALVSLMPAPKIPTVVP